jgi:hypothetical protein
VQSDLLHIITEKGDPEKVSLSRSRIYASLVPPSSPWNILGRHMIRVHTPTGAVVSLTLISPERYE